MIESVVIDFAARGISETLRAFDQIETRIIRIERASEQSVRRTKDSQVRANQDVAASGERSAQQQERSAQRQEREIEARRRRSSEMAGRYAAQTARAEERAAQEGSRAVEREEERKMRIRIRSSEMAGRLAAQEAAAEIRAAEAATAARQRLGTRMLRTGASSVGGMTSMAAGIGGLVGGFYLVEQARKEANFERTVGLLINATTTGGTPPSEANFKNIRGVASQVSKETGVDRNDIAEAGLAYARGAKGGDIKGVLGNMGFFTKMSMVTGADIKDIAGAAGVLQSQNQALGGANNKDMQQMLLNVIAQSHAGSVSMDVAAKQIGTLGSTRGLYQGDEGVNQRKLLALGQLAAPGGDPGDIGTYIKNVSLEAQAHLHKGEASKWLRGVKTDKFGRFESPEQLITQVFRNTGGDLGKMHEVFGNRGIPLMTQLQGSYVKAGGGEKGIAALRQTIAGVSEATSTPDDLNKAVDRMLAEPSKRLEVAFNRLSETTKTGLAPVMEHLADKMPELIPVIEKFLNGLIGVADWFARDPLQHSIEAMGAKMLLDVAKVGFGEKLAGAVAGLGPFGIAIGAATAAIIALYNAANAVSATNKEHVEGDIGDINLAGKITKEAREGKVTPGDLETANKAVKSTQERLAKEKEAAAGAGGWNPWVGFLGGDDRKKNADQEVKNTEDVLKRLQKAAELAAAALSKHSEAAGKVDPARTQPLPVRGAGGF